jgi:hypothetical protein
VCGDLDLSGLVYPYTLRRTVGTLLTDKLPAREVSDLLGHSRISPITDIYVGQRSFQGAQPMSSAHARTANEGFTRSNSANQGLQGLGLVFCAPPGTRTPNPLIKSQLLCQLS